MELVVDSGSQPVTVWNVEDHVMAQRIDSAEHKHTEIDMDSPPTWAEKKAARTASMDAHENARKGAVPDVLKSALRGYGEQFGNSLYGDGTKTQQASRPATVEQLKHINAFCERLNRPRATSATLTLTSCCMNSCKPTIRAQEISIGARLAPG